MKPFLLVIMLVLAGCATDIARVVSPGMAPGEVSARVGKPIVAGQSYWDYSRQPHGYYRVSFGADKRVSDVRNLHTEENFLKLQPGMTPQQVAATVGITSYIESYAFGTTSWRYRYRDAGIAKLLHVIFDSGERLAWYYWEWDPEIYSKGGNENRE
jgi:hypothetical protein